MTPLPTDRTGFVGTAATSVKSITLSTTPTVTPFSTSTLTPVRTNAPVSAPGLATQLAPQRQSSHYHSDASFGKGTGKIIVLFRSDLRLDDHPAISHAIEEAASVIPVYCFDPRHFGRTQYGFEKTGKYRARFLIDSVTDLRRSLRAKGSDLVVRIGRPEDVVLDLCKKLNCRTVFMHREVIYEDQQVEHRLEKALKEKGADLQLFWSNTLYYEDDIPFEVKSMPDIYSDFREALAENGTIRTPLPVPESIPRLPHAVSPGEMPTLAALGIDDSPSRLPHGATGVGSFTGGESEAVLRVSTYVKDSKRYETQRSPRFRVTAHLGADFSCRISPWLALGCISPRRIFDEVKKVTAMPMESNTYFELVWRDFFKYIMYKYTRERAAASSRTASHSKALARW